MDALIGCSGFVGSTLSRQRTFSKHYRSTNIGEISGQQFDTVICAAAPAKKWLANQNPDADRDSIDHLISHLGTIQCKTLVLISTVDVFQDPNGIDENSLVVEEGLHPYGLNRRRLEKYVASHFESTVIVRLPGLVGPGLRKNIIFDLLNNNNLSSVDSRSHFQFYPMVNLWVDIQRALALSQPIIHLTATPTSVREVAKEGFGLVFDNILEPPPARYDFRSIHANAFGGSDGYQYNKREVFLAIRAYAQSELRSLESVLA